MACVQQCRSHIDSYLVAVGSCLTSTHKKAKILPKDAGGHHHRHDTLQCNANGSVCNRLLAALS